MTVQRSDLEDKLKEIQEVIDDTAEGARNVGVAAAIAVVLVILLVYLMGRRKGRKGAAQVEIYRLG
jgi:ABC-type spermidine/putrescine transport system permease subunit I